MSEENKSYIAGIYNYCDRWCEKCTFTSNCLLFTNESKIVAQEILKPGESIDIEKIFDMNFDNEENLPGEISGEQDEEIKEDNTEINKYPLSILADNFFSKSMAIIKKMDERYNFFAQSGKKEPGSAFSRLFEDFEIFAWFNPLIVAKLKRAVSSKLEMQVDDDEDMLNIREYDMNGSAKISIIALEKTVKALNKLFDRMPEFKNEITELLILSGELLNLTEEEFPGFNGFIRPGFDE